MLVALLVCVFVGVLVGVFVGVLVGVFVGVFVGVLVGVSVGVFVGVFVGVSVGVFVGVLVGVFVGVSVGVFVGELVGVFVGLFGAVLVGVSVGVVLGALDPVAVGHGCLRDGVGGEGQDPGELLRVRRRPVIHQAEIGQWGRAGGERERSAPIGGGVLDDRDGAGEGDGFRRERTILLPGVAVARVVVDAVDQRAAGEREVGGVVGGTRNRGRRVGESPIRTRRDVAAPGEHGLAGRVARVQREGDREGGRA